MILDGIRFRRSKTLVWGYDYTQPNWREARLIWRTCKPLASPRAKPLDIYKPDGTQVWGEPIEGVTWSGGIGYCSRDARRCYAIQGGAVHIGRLREVEKC